MTKSIKNSIPVQPLHGTAKKVKKSATTYFSSTADVCTDELDVNLPYASIVGFAWGIPDAQSCRWLCGHNHPEATHFTWLDYRTNHQIANSLEHKCNCKKDVSTKKDEVGAVSGVMHCDIKGKWMQRLMSQEKVAHGCPDSGLRHPESSLGGARAWTLGS